MIFVGKPQGHSSFFSPKCPKRTCSIIIVLSRQQYPRHEENMAKHNYLCIQRSQPSQFLKGERPSPAQMEEMYAKFNAWKAKFQSNIVDMGGRLGGGKIVTLEGATDGPFVEAKEVIGGFMIISADSLEEAAEIARECPGVVSPGSSVEVREITVP